VESGRKIDIHPLMYLQPSRTSIIGAFLTGLLAVGSTTLAIDPTPMLAEPKPDLDLAVGLSGLVAGLWSARVITQLPYVANRRVGRWALWIMLPLWLGFGLASLAERLQEWNSFRGGSVSEEMAVSITGKSKSSGRRIVYTVSVASPVEEHDVSIRVDQAVFERVRPNHDCVTLLIERAPDGAARMIDPLNWNPRPCDEAGTTGAGEQRGLAEDGSARSA